MCKVIMIRFKVCLIVILFWLVWARKYWWWAKSNLCIFLTGNSDRESCCRPVAHCLHFCWWWCLHIWWESVWTVRNWCWSTWDSPKALGCSEFGKCTCKNSILWCSAQCYNNSRWKNVLLGMEQVWSAWLRGRCWPQHSFSSHSWWLYTKKCCMWVVAYSSASWITHLSP